MLLAAPVLESKKEAIGVVENPTGSKPTSPGRDPSRVAGQPFSANGRAAEGRSNGTPFNAVDETDCWDGANADAEAINIEAIASFMVVFILV
jgi:hypothetical protein